MSKSGLGFRLSNADAERPAKNKLAQGIPLDDKSERQVLARMPTFKAPAQTKTVALREKSIPAPRPGETIKSAFPPPATLPPPASVGAGGRFKVCATLRTAPSKSRRTSPSPSTSPWSR